MAVGSSLEFPPPITAGAVISGAYFGDKLSLLSDTTNLSAAITGTPVLTHIRYMLITTVPAYVATLIIFQSIGFFFSPEIAQMSTAGIIEKTLNSNFELSWIVLAPAAVTIVLLIFQLPPYVAIFGGVIGATVVSTAVQGNSLTEVIQVTYSGFTLDSGLSSIDKLISGGGMMSMAGISLLFLFAVGVAGLLEKGGFTTTVIERVLRVANSRRKLMTMSSPLTILSIGLGANFSFAAVMIGTLLTNAYQSMGLKSQNLSRTIEDSGTVYDPFFPWSAGGVFAAGTLGIGTLEYMPFLFFAYLSTVFGLLVAITQFKVSTIDLQD
ncbi:MAG: Na+/H+ antiporter NhaC family protein [Halomonas sp.]|uniref:Na+/H+ antiporter NhaC family protein n=1 Tax=Halomonas sp. TaxID=1486246 RepID=UPI003F938D5D